MADIAATLKIMPTSPEIDLNLIKEEALEMIKEFSGMDNNKVREEDIAFGLKALIIMFVMSEDIGAIDPLEEKISGIDGVNSVEVTDVRRVIG